MVCMMKVGQLFCNKDMGGYAWLSRGLSTLVHLFVMVVIFGNVGATFNVASTR